MYNEMGKWSGTGVWYLFSLCVAFFFFYPFTVGFVGQFQTSHLRGRNEGEKKQKLKILAKAGWIINQFSFYHHTDKLQLSSWQKVIIYTGALPPPNGSFSYMHSLHGTVRFNFSLTDYAPAVCCKYCAVLEGEAHRGNHASTQISIRGSPSRPCSAVLALHPWSTGTTQ